MSGVYWINPAPLAPLLQIRVHVQSTGIFLEMETENTVLLIIKITWTHIDHVLWCRFPTLDSEDSMKCKPHIRFKHFCSCGIS